MITATANDLTLPLIGGRHHFLLRRLHSLTGIIFGGYLIVHLFINATLIQGWRTRDIYQLQVNKIHVLPFLRGVEWIFIYLPIIYHAIYGIYITFTAQWNVDRYPYAKNWFYVLQRIFGLYLAGFILFHVLAMKWVFGAGLAFDPEHATGSIAQHMNASWALPFLVYPLGIVASAYHTANGFWTAGITWGLTTSADGQRRWGGVCTVLGVFLFACGMLALYATVHAGPYIHQLLSVPYHG
ncbi:MAG TPA: hypothetical protein VFC78_01360 [Tepidisphaeraceae bacterium]|nr:hypothetical protein [Tepidisphaeraceae bacterium]